MKIEISKPQTAPHVASSQGIVFPRSVSTPAAAEEGLLKPKPRRLIKRSLIVGGVLVIVLCGGGLAYIFHSHSRASLSSDQSAASLVAAVGKSIELPAETPTIATVTDPSKLSSQSFFAGAQVGDKVLIYSKAGKAILYRPSEHKVITVAPLTSSK